ncbi:MAG: efflux RND transporter permease subunit [Planctomycetes bacterium]|nr:efflux RND transporter permease subunit [Planctomycetota bacterium]
MTLSDLSIKKPVFAWMLMILFMVLGGVAFVRLGVSQMPDVDFPIVNVSLAWEGAAPEIMENDVVDIVEDAVMSVEGIKEVSSVSRHGSANVTIEFNLERDIDAALQDVQTKLAQARRLLPPDLDPPVITKTNPEDQPIMWVGLSGPRPPRELADLVRNQLKDQLQVVPGVGEVMLGGFLSRNVRIWLDANRLEAYGLSADDVIAALRREHIEVPVGRIESPSRELNVRSEGEALDLEGFRKLIIASSGLGQVRLQDVALVEDGLEDRRRISRSNGQHAQGMGIKKQRGANAVAVSRGVRAKVEELKEQVPPDLSFEVVFDSTPYIEESIREIQITMMLAVFLTAFVCWLFLGSLGSTLNIVLAIPTSILGTFAVMYFMGFTLNTFTLLALTLSIGIVVDDAIMVMENIFRHRQTGKDKVEAARVGAREITFAAMAATAAIISIFLPIAFTKGIIGKFLFQFGVVLSVAVLLSLIEALTIAPARCAQFLEVEERTTRLGRSIDFILRKLARGYRLALRPAIRWRWAVLGSAMLLFAGSLTLFRVLRSELVPSQDQSRFLVRMQTPVGSSIDFTDSVCREAEEFMLQQPELRRYYAAVGGFGGGEVNTAVMFVTLKSPRERTRTMQDMIALVRARFNSIPGLKAFPMDLSTMGFSAQRGFPVEVSIRGPEWSKLAELGDRLMDRMRGSGLVTDVDTDYQVGMPELYIVPDRKKAADAGISMAAIGNTVGALIGGTRVGKYKEEGRRYDVRVRLLREQRLRPEDVRSIKVRSLRGDLVPLSEVASIDERPTMLTINRRGRERAIAVYANVAPGKSQADAFAEVERLWREIQEEGYRMVFSGSAQTAKETFTSLIFVMILGIFIAYVVLASQFNSFIHPITVFLALPFSVMGALLALWIAGISINIYSAIGIILLMGIAKKNSIILVDYTNQRRERGATWKEALLQACPVRLRPILMTSFSTIAGALPPALSLGTGSEVIRPMALAVIGGIAVSTLFTLFVVPAFYGMVEDVKRVFRGRSGDPGRSGDKEFSQHISPSPLSADLP